MSRIRLAILIAVAFAVAGCAGIPGRDSLERGRVPPDRPDGQPGWWPCMLGDRLCKPP